MKNKNEIDPKNPCPLLEFKNVTVIKGENKKVLDAISLTVHEGENVAILGPNGAGKSSFIKTITREYYPLSSPDGFAFKIWGEELWNVFDLRNLLGVVSNDLQHHFMRDITGLEMVLSGFFSSIGLYNENITPQMREKADEVIEFLEIAHLKNREITEMSSGEGRRFLIGRALVHDPKALILDEPTNSLDLLALHKFSDILRKIAQSGISVILVTQSLHDIIPEIGRVILMKGGRIYKDGPKAEVLTDENISRLFGTPVEIKRKKGYFYGLRG